MFVGLRHLDGVELLQLGSQLRLSLLSVVERGQVAVAAIDVLVLSALPLVLNVYVRKLQQTQLAGVALVPLKRHQLVRSLGNERTLVPLSVPSGQGLRVAHSHLLLALIDCALNVLILVSVVPLLLVLLALG